ncbi:MAG: cell division protein ZapE, partial [Proteobacteria bacterium]|nr:cell division protein ZapE [Pseudomonadota bacterium]
MQREGHVEDPAQLDVIARLEDLGDRLRDARSDRGLAGLFSRKKRPARVQGLYIWGGVGRGKTFLMDLFFENLPAGAKERRHFHRMMREVHDRLKALGDVRDPLDRIAADIARATRVLCFDEFFVSDIGDAMILGRLLRGLFDRGVTLVATSNVKPDDLYKDGL